MQLQLRGMLRCSYETPERGPADITAGETRQGPMERDPGTVGMDLVYALFTSDRICWVCVFECDPSAAKLWWISSLFPSGTTRV
jgi:hypothetical protein